MSLSDMHAWDKEHGWRYDIAARQHVEGVDEELATTTFGPLHLYGIHEPVSMVVIDSLRSRLADNDNATVSTEWVDGFLSTLSDNQKKAALEYDGEECFGDDAFRNKARGPYITTYTGRFYMFDPRPEDWHIVDVAHGLANICRYTGAGNRRYSVAEHCVHLYRALTKFGCTPDERLAGLTHDAPESLSGFGDVASPAKKRAPVIKQTEENIYRKAIAPKLHLDPELPEIVHEFDMRICHDEMTQNLWEVDPKVGPPLGVTLEYWNTARAEEEYLLAYYEVQRQRQEQARAA